MFTNCFFCWLQDKRYLKALVEEVAQEEAEKIEWAKKWCDFL